jgi:hypothetical protein
VKLAAQAFICAVVQTNWKPMANYYYGFSKIPYGFAKGNSIQVDAGHVYPIEILIGERPGGEFTAFLLLEKNGAQYAGAPKLPIFKLAPSPMPQGGNGVPAVAPNATSISSFSLSLTHSPRA